MLGTLALLVTLEFGFQPHVPVPALVNLCWLPSSTLALWLGKEFFNIFGLVPAILSIFFTHVPVGSGRCRVSLNVPFDNSASVSFRSCVEWFLEMEAA